ncbi:MAG: exodeoxyribonuclease VII large subunit, partial [Gammaproteobacteria bacterium]|nr:exodeoxyribonuclease VII large subunit [Gammaproteobacteria bacterium]
PIPVISAVGHEVDFTIADFVADLRAPTPSGAAEIVVPSQHDWRHRTATLAVRIARIGERAVQDRAQQMDWLGGRLASAMHRQFLTNRHQLQAARSELLQLSPAVSVQRSIGRLVQLRQRLASSMHTLVSSADHRIALLGRALHSVSPLATLERGYAIVRDVGTGKVLLRAGDANSGDEILARLSEGELVATVTKVIDND